MRQVLVLSALVLSLSVSAAPMDAVFTLLDTGGGVQSGKTKEDGYYLTGLGFSSRTSEAKGYEEARLEALRHLNEMVNGVTISGSTYSNIEYLSEADGQNNHEYSREEFRDVVNLSFKGHLSAAKVLKKGKYDGKYFVAIAITETDAVNIAGLKSTTSNRSDFAGYQTKSVAGFSGESKTVEAKGLATLKNGEQKARTLAIQDAMRNAIQQVQGVMLQGKSGAFNESLSFALSTKTEGYVGSYEILDEDIARGSYTVLILAHVNSAQLLNDVNFYLDIFNEPVFSIQSENKVKKDWLSNELERLGFNINDGKTKPTHTFYLKQSQQQITNHNGKTGIETALTVKLKDNVSGETVFTIMNDPFKSRIYVNPLERAKRVSEISAYKKLKKQIGVEVVQSLASYAERGKLYQIEIRHAQRTDWDIFSHTLNNGTGGSVESWKWSKNGKVMTLNFRYSGKLSQAMDEGLQQLYQVYRKEGKGRRPTALKISGSRAVFEMVTG